MLEALGLPGTDPIARRLAGAQPEGPPDWMHLAAAVARSLMPPAAAAAPGAAGAPWRCWGEDPLPLVFGVAGGQGSGKSTFSRQLVAALTASGARAVSCSLDDFYLSKARRLDLARRVHPLLATRGVPGTHDVDALSGVIAGLGTPGVVSLPGFDKGADDPVPADRRRFVEAPVDMLVLEGWCVGARPQADADLAEPVNALERAEDPDGRWRRYVNAALAGDYAAVWARLDALMFIEVPGLDAVRRWRTQQEQALPAGQRMDGAAIERFVAHYERLTRAMRADLPARASLHVRLDDDHRIAALRAGPRRTAPDRRPGPHGYSESIQR